MTETSPDVFQLTADLVDIASESFVEQSLVDWLMGELIPLSHLEVTRVGDNVVARTNFGRSQRLILGGHTDTVPMNANFPGRIEGDTLWGVGSADMKGGLAVMLTSARQHSEVPIDLTYVFYAREEVAATYSGLVELFAERPDLMVGDVALMGEPTNAMIEAGCQGSVRAEITLGGARAHTARAWMGRNAIHRAGELLAALSDYQPRQPVLSGCHFHEAMQAVGIEGGVSGNVVPDSVTITIAHRFAPDKTADEAESHLREVVAPFLESGDRFEVVDVASAAPPAVDHPLIAKMIKLGDLSVTAKLGWTDVARFAERGIPAANFGPGDPTIAHTQGEHVERSSVERAWLVLDTLIRSAAE